MSNDGELLRSIKQWLERVPAAKGIADKIISKAESKGEIAKSFTFPFDEEIHNALIAMFSAEYVRIASKGTKSRVRFQEWELKNIGSEGEFLFLLAEAGEVSFHNRSLDKSKRKQALESVLSQYTAEHGVVGEVARRELIRMENGKGRFWYRCRKWDVESFASILAPYFRLLACVDEMKAQPDRFEQVVHLSRRIAGDTHWLRPGNRVWRDLALDLIDFDDSIAEITDELASRSKYAKALNLVGIVENLTSILVMAFGRFDVVQNGQRWRWASEAAEINMPVWFSARHLSDSKVLPATPLKQVICVENETSFLDLTQDYSNDPSTLLVYTEGHANRAVIGFLRLLNESSPQATFRHQGDLDLYGVRILDSLIERTGIPIEPMLMSVETHREHAGSGIPLNQKELESLNRFLNSPRAEASRCVDLLQEIFATGVRIEQECFSSNQNRENQSD